MGRERKKRRERETRIAKGRQHMHRWSDSNILPSARKTADSLFLVSLLGVFVASMFPFIFLFSSNGILFVF